MKQKASAKCGSVFRLLDVRDQIAREQRTWFYILSMGPRASLVGEVDESANHCFVHLHGSHRVSDQGKGTGSLPSQEKKLNVSFESWECWPESESSSHTVPNPGDLPRYDKLPCQDPMQERDFSFFLVHCRKVLKMPKLFVPRSLREAADKRQCIVIVPELTRSSHEKVSV